MRRPVGAPRSAACAPQLAVATRVFARKPRGNARPPLPRRDRRTGRDGVGASDASAQLFASAVPGRGPRPDRVASWCACTDRLQVGGGHCQANRTRAGLRCTARTSRGQLGAGLPPPDPEGLGAIMPVAGGGYSAAVVRWRRGRKWPWMQLCAERNRRAWAGGLGRCILRPRRRVGRCEFSARLFQGGGWSGAGPRAGWRAWRRRSCAGHR